MWRKYGICYMLHVFFNNNNNTMDRFEIPVKITQCFYAAIIERMCKC